MTGSAKQSIYPLAEAWIASSQALLAMTGVRFRIQLSNSERMWLRIPAARCARALLQLPPSQEKKRAQGKPGARCTRGLVCKTAQKRAHEHTGSADASGLTCAVVYGLLRALPGERAFLPPSPAGHRAR